MGVSRGRGSTFEMNAIFRGVDAIRNLCTPDSRRVKKMHKT